MPGATLLVLLGWLAGASPLRVSFSVSSTMKLVTLQDFSTSGGTINVSISVAPGACFDTIGNSTGCWDVLDQTYLSVLNFDQWRNLSHWLAQNDAVRAATGSTELCPQPAVGWSSLSLLSWQEAAIVPGGSGAADFRVSGRGFEPAVSAHEGIRPAPSPPAPITFQIGFRLPPQQDIYTLSIYNCFGEELHATGEARFVGGAGETLSTRQLDVLAVRFGLMVLILACAVALAVLCAMCRATMVPLHGLFILVLLLRCLQQGFLALPLMAASQDVISPAGGIITAAALDAYNSPQRDTSMRQEPMWPPPAPGVQPGDFPAPAIGGNVPLAPPPPSPYGVSGPIYRSPAASINAADWGLQSAALLSAAAAEQLASISFITALLAIAGGRHFFFASTPAREREGICVAFVLYFGFGMLQEACTGEVLCGVFVLFYQVIRILLIFAVLLFLNATSDHLRRATGHVWPALRVDLLRLIAFRQIRMRLLLVYLILPIIFLFLEVVLDWQHTWSKVLWRESLELYVVLAVVWRLPPTLTIYSIHFAPLRPAPNAELAPGAYPRFFRWLLGSSVHAPSADAATAAGTANAQRQQQQQHYGAARNGRRSRTD